MDYGGKCLGSRPRVGGLVAGVGFGRWDRELGLKGGEALAVRDREIP